MVERRGSAWSWWQRRQWSGDDRLEIPVSFFGGWWGVPDDPVNQTGNLTGTEIEALMSTAPGEDPTMPDPTNHYGDPYEMLDGMDLTDFERSVLDTIVIAGLSYRQAGRVLDVSHSSVYRTHKSLMKRIRKQMGADDE